MPSLPTEELIARYSGPGPRYTSYPAANLWREVDAHVALKAAERANGLQAPLSLYVHIPFCQEMCRFCGCNVIATRDRARGDTYLDTLEQELALWAARLPDRREVSQLHLGGGTPTFLQPSQLERLHRLITTHFSFTPDAEKALEVDPVVTTPEQLSLLAQLGFRRLSIGVQDLDPTVQEAIARPQTPEETERIIDEARRAGFENVNFDLIYGLPFQTPDTMRTTLGQLVRMSPDRFSLFGYAHVPWMKPNQRLIPAAHLPAAVERVQLFVTAAELLETAGYRQIGLDHFAHANDRLARAQAAGTLTRNFQGYAERAAPDTLAVGPSAISDLGGAFLQNTHKYSEWTKRVIEGDFATTKGHARTADDDLRAEAIRDIMCLFRLERSRLVEHHGSNAQTLWEEATAMLLPLRDDGLVELEPDLLTVTPMGRLFVRAVAMRFDPLLAAMEGKRAFSSTV